MPGPSDSMRMTADVAVTLNCAFCGQKAVKGHFCKGLYEATFHEERSSNEKAQDSEISTVGRDPAQG